MKDDELDSGSASIIINAEKQISVPGENMQLAKQRILEEIGDIEVTSIILSYMNQTVTTTEHMLGLLL